jgi:nickel-dependent lactate racemase
MTYDLRYGDRSIKVDILGETDVINAVHPITPPDEKSLVLDAICRASLPIAEFLGDSSSVAILVSDNTRNTGSRIYMPILLDLAKRKGRKIAIIIALGLHRPSTRGEIAEILGCDPGAEVEVRNHDPDASLSACRGGLFCRTVVEAEKIILTGSVTFHPMAGYSGGWKSLLPGVASRKDVIENHRLYFAGTRADACIGPAHVQGNPILTDIRERTKEFSGKAWCLNVVQDEAKSIVYAAAGRVEDAWNDCSAYLGSHNSPRIGRLYDVVVESAGGYPSDFSFYQSMKTLTNAARCCVTGGSIFLLMECRNGWELERQVMSLARLELDEIAARVTKEFTMSGLAVFMALSVIRTHKVFLLASLPRPEVEYFGMRYIASANEIGNLATAERKDRIAIMPAAASVLPVLERR